MPELPDITVYCEALESRVAGQPLEAVRLANPFFVRTFDPPLAQVHGLKVLGLSRMGKRIVFQLEDEYYLVLHLMIAGRLHWKPRGVKIPGKIGHAAIDFPSGTLTVTEAGTQKKASLHCVKGKKGLAALNPGGMEILGSTVADFAHQLRRENHTLKRSLTDPRMFSGIGNSYSDEILHRAKLSPMKQTHKLEDAEVERLHEAILSVMTYWTDKLREEAGDHFPENVTAFREGMAVHGRFKQPCPVCGTAVQRIAYAQNECNYCPRCQTDGKLLADRAFSRLLKDDWPKTIQELEERWAAR